MITCIMILLLVHICILRPVPFIDALWNPLEMMCKTTALILFYSKHLLWNGSIITKTNVSLVYQSKSKRNHCFVFAASKVTFLTSDNHMCNNLSLVSFTKWNNWSHKMKTCCITFNYSHRLWLYWSLWFNFCHWNRCFPFSAEKRQNRLIHSIHKVK